MSLSAHSLSCSRPQRQRPTVRCLLAAGLLALVLLPNAPAVACVLRVRQNADPTALMRGADGLLSGPQVETVREALRRIGCSAVIVPLPWARALLDLETGRLDVLPDTHRVPEREAFAWFSRSTWASTVRVFMRVSDLGAHHAPRSLEAFAQRKLRLGVQTGVRYGADIDRLLKSEPFKDRLERAPSRQGLWKMLALGRIDGVLAGEQTGRRELVPLGLAERVAAAPIRLAEEPSHTAFSRATVKAGLVDRFDAALLAMRQDGTIERIERFFE